LRKTNWGFVLQLASSIHNSLKKEYISIAKQRRKRYDSQQISVKNPVLAALTLARLALDK
jgi:hypothetical protein